MRSLTLVLVLLSLSVVDHACSAEQRSGPEAYFHQQIEPILVGRCLTCHGSESKGSLDLRTRTTALAGGDSGKVIQPGKSAVSLLYEFVESHQMPPDKPLSAKEIDAIKTWIDQGFYYPDTPLDPFTITTNSRAGYDWWSLQPLAKAQPPTSSDLPASWSEHPIDRFIAHKLAAQGIEPSPPAEPRQLIRRATYNLLGLPPTADEVDAFLAACAAETGSEGKVGKHAYEAVLDRLLASDHYGQQWGRHWLDVVRFGESNGFERNVIHTNVWPFRDYVIRSFNEDKPFNQLVMEHLAGDVIGPEDLEVAVGTAFLVCGPYDNVGNQDAEAAAQIRADTIDEFIRASSEAFLGLTVGCSRCHDHKFDPISQRDYYRMYASLAGVRHGERTVQTKQSERLKQELEAVNAQIESAKQQLQSFEAPAKGEPSKSPAIAPQDRSQDEQVGRLKESLQRLKVQSEKLAGEVAALKWWIGNFEDAPGPFHVFAGGDPQRKGVQVSPASLNALSGTTESYQLQPDSAENKRRRALGEWVVAEDNPLTPRVAVNRLWHYHFGTGIVNTPSDFGFLGGRPSHPKLLDWLAVQFQDSGWRLKPLHKTIMLSQTYRQSSESRPQAARVDNDSRLLWRFPPRRLAAEEIRDSALMVAGKLDNKMGGPGFRLFRYVEDNVAAYHPLDKHGPETFRRAVYHHNARAMQIDLMSEFDKPDCAFPTPRRSSTTTPLQALTLMNHSFTLDMATALAERLERETSTSDYSGQVDRAFRLAFTRRPDEGETAAAVELIELHGLPAFCRALLNANEFIYLD